MIYIRFSRLVLAPLLGCVALFCASTIGHAQVFQSRDAQDRIDRVEAPGKAMLERKRLANSAKSAGAGGSEAAQSGGKGEIAPWKVRTVRYTCASGLSLTTVQRTASDDALASISDRRELNEITIAANSPRAKINQTELDGLDDLDSALKKRQPIKLTLKYKSYNLTAEKSALGWHYVNRAQGISWGQRQRKGILKNMFSGRILASDCIAGAPLLVDSLDSEDIDVPVATIRP